LEIYCSYRFILTQNKKNAPGNRSLRGASRPRRASYGPTEGKGSFGERVNHQIAPLDNNIMQKKQIVQIYGGAGKIPTMAAAINQTIVPKNNPDTIDTSQKSMFSKDLASFVCLLVYLTLASFAK